MALKNKTFSAVRWTTTAAIVRGLLQLVQIAVLTRLLSPADYGLMAMVSVVLNIAVLFSDMGLNSAYVQKQQVSSEHRSSLFWLNIGMSMALSILLIAISPMLAWLFGEERLTLLLMLSSTIFILSALGQQLRMTAEKELNFKPVALLEITSALLGFVAAVISAAAGLGVYALVLGGITSALVGSILAWIFIARGWRPVWRFKIDDIRPYIGFGSSLVGNSVANQINMSIDLLLGGRLLGAVELGLFSVPRNLILQVQFMVNPIVTRVGFPLIAQVQHDIHKVRLIYVKTLNMTASTNAPLYVGIAYFASDMVHALFGPAWTGSAELLRIMAVWGFFRSTGNPAGSLVLGMGRADLAFKWNIAQLFIALPILWVGSNYGAEGLALSMLIFMLMYFLPAWYFLIYPLCRVGLIEFTVSALKPFIISCLAIAPAYILSLQVEGPILRLFLGVVIATPIYLMLSYFFNREWIQALQSLVGRR